MDIERRLYLRLFSFCIGRAMEILSYFIDTCVLNHAEFDSFLNLLQHTHQLFHRWSSKTPCCECISSVSIAAPHKDSILKESHLKTIYKLDGKEVPGHVNTNKKGYKTQDCLCKVTAITGITTENLDIALVHCLIKTCDPATFSKVGVHIEVIRRVRNDLVHPSRGTVMSEVDFNTSWNNVEKAVLAIAKVVSTSYERHAKKLISPLKNTEVNLQDVIEKVESSGDDIKRLYDNIINEHENKFRQIIDKQDISAKDTKDKSETDKQEILKHITDQTIEVLKEIKESGKVCRICRRVDVAEILCRKDTQAIEASCEVTGENMDEELMLSNLQPNDFEQNSGFNIKSATKECIILELSSSPDIFQSRESFRRAILSLITRIEQAGELDSSIPYSIEFNLTFNTPLTQDEVRTISSLSTLRLNGDTTQEMQADHGTDSRSNITGEIEVLVERAPIKDETLFDDYDVLPQKGKENEDDLSIEIRKLTFPVKLHGMATEMKSETTETTIYKTEDSDRCQVEWRLRIPDIWKVDQKKQTLENVSQMLHQLFRIECIYIDGPLMIHTSVPIHVLRDKQILKSAIQSFLEKIAEVCEINTDVPETVNVDFRVLEITSRTEIVEDRAERRMQGIPDSSKVKHEITENTPNVLEKVFFTSIIADSNTFTMVFKGIPTHPEEDRLLHVNSKFYAQWIWTCPDSWNVESLVENIGRKTSHLQNWFFVDLVHIDYSGKLVIHTTTEQHVFNTAESLTTAATTFLLKIVDICNLQTDRPEEVKIEVAIMSDIANVTAETVKSEVKRLTKFPVHIETESTTEEDNVSCKHCHKQFPCDQCSVRRTICKQIGFLVEDNRKKTKIITDMEMEPEFGDSNDHEFSQITKTTEPLDLGEPPYKMLRLSGHGEDAETATSTQPEAEYINWLKKNIEIYKGRVDSLEQSLVNSKRSKARINAKHQRQLKQPSTELTMGDYLELVRVQQRFKRQKSDFDTLTKQLRCYQTALQSQGQSTKIREQFDKGPDTTDTEYSDDIMCQLCVADQRPALCLCTECVQPMCRECTTVHRTQPTSSTHIPVLIIHDYNFQIKGTYIWDIASLCEEVLIISDRDGKQLITCDIRGNNKQFISLPYSPYRVSVIDQNNVAVTTCFDKKVLIVDVKQKTVTIEIDIKKGCRGIMYRDNHLYVICDNSLVKVDMSGQIIRTVPLSFTPYCICSGTEGRIYCTDYHGNTVYCIDTEGNPVFTVTNHDMSNPSGITTDNERHVLVVCLGSQNVHRISPDGKQCNVIIKDTTSRISYDPCMCYDSISKSIVISNGGTVYVYTEYPEQ